MDCEMMDTRSQTCYKFVAWDYVVFGSIFLISSCIGLYVAYRSKKHAVDYDGYLLGGRNMSTLPVAMSLLASSLSSITVLGTPAEFYVYGTMFSYIAIPYLTSAIIVSEIYIPIFCRLKITSTYEYLELRFNKPVRILATTVYMMNTILYVGIVIYAPSLALNAVTGLGLWWSVALTGVVCTFYTSLGGMKAVVWTDVFQCLVMWIGFLAIITRGSAVMGGFHKVWAIAQEGGRIQYDKFEIDPRIRHSFWSICIGGTFIWTGIFGTTQTSVQRYLSCKSEKDAKMTIFLNLIGLYILLVLPCLSGLIMYAYYAGCDPYTEGWVGATDQLMPYFVLELLHQYPGLPGVYVSSAFSGTLSTVSSGINAMATVTVEDYIKPVKNLSPNKSVILSKVLVIVYGTVCMAMAVLASQLGGVLQAAISLSGLVGGPMVGLFTLAILLPWCNSIGALVGIVCGLASTTWVYIGSIIYPPTDEMRGVLPSCTSSCNATTDYSCGKNYDHTNVTTSVYMPTTEASTENPPPSISNLYAMSYLYYPVLGFFVTVVTGLIVSFLTGYQRPSQLPPGTILPFFDHPIFRWIPQKIRRKLWCGVRQEKEQNVKSNVKPISKPTHESFHNIDLMAHSDEVGSVTHGDVFQQESTTSKELKGYINGSFGNNNVESLTTKF